MKASLIYPLLSKTRSLVDENKQYWVPLGLAYIAAILEKKGHGVQILDRDYILRKNKFDFTKTDEVTVNLIKEFDAQIVGFSATTPNISDVNRFSKKIKEAKPEIITVVGGPHPTGEPVDTLKICGSIDILVRGEGEMTMLDIANGIDIKNIAGLTYKREDGIIISNPDRPLVETLDDLSIPARHLVDMDFYSRPSRFISRNLSLRASHIFTTRGCPYNCHYCAGPLMGQRKVRYHSPQRVIEEIEELIEKYAIEAIYFADDMFLSNKIRAMEIIDLLIKHRINKKIVWMAQVNPNAVDIKLLSMMKKGGCVHVEYGFESGSQRILKLMNKNTDVERNKLVAAIIKKSGLRFQGNFIVGYPGETEEDFNKTISFIKETRPNNISLNIFMPLPGTQVHMKLKQDGRLIPNWDDFGDPAAPYINYADMPEHRFEELYFKAKLKVILPMNLFYFLKDNIGHPFRLSYIISTQFRGVLIRTFKSIKELLGSKKKEEKSSKTERNIRVLFLVYHSAFYPIMESQGFSYMRRLSEMGIKYSLLTFETGETLNVPKSALEDLKETFNWRYLFYHRRPRALVTLFDIIFGIFATSIMVKKNKIGIIHARGLISAAIAFLPAKIFRVKFIFDTRGFLADKYVGGGLLKKNSFIYKLMRWGEDFLTRKSDFFTVETYRHADIIRDLKDNRLIKKMEIIPCCVDINKFNYLLYKEQIEIKEKKFNLVYLGKIGTWYLIDEMLDFFNVLSKEINNSYFIFLIQDSPDHIYLAAGRKKIPIDKIVVKNLSLQEIPSALACQDAGIFFINPYRRYNSSPIKYGEYLASGLPVIINSGIGDTDIITEREEVGVVIRNFSVNDYEIAAKKLIGLLKEKNDLRQRCRNVAEKYLSLEQGVNRYLTVYQKVLSDESPILGSLSNRGIKQ